MNGETLASIAQLQDYVFYASKPLFIYDFLLMLPMEVALLRRAKWTLLKIAYLLARYTLFIDFAVCLGSFSVSLDCKVTNAFYTSSSTFGIAMTEVVLTYRLWTLLNQDRRLAYVLTVVFCILSATCVALLTQFVSSSNLVVFPHPFDTGCYELAGNRNIWVPWVLLLLYNAGGLMLLVHGRVTATRGPFEHSPFLKQLFRNGIAYYSVFSTITLINVFGIFLLPEANTSLSGNIVRTLHSNLSSRIILDIYTDTNGVNSIIEDPELEPEFTYSVGHNSNQY